MATAAPVDPSFMGYRIGGNQTSERYCGPLQTYTTFSLNIAACCPKASTVLCNYYTTCSDQCSAPGFSCMSQTIYATYPTISPHTHFVCAGPGWDWNTLYREIPATTSDLLGAASTLTPPGASASPTSAVVLPSATNEVNPPHDNPIPSGSSNDWIAAAVLGPLVAIALLGGTIWFLRRRRKFQRKTGISELADTSHGRYHRHQSDVQPLTLSEADPLRTAVQDESAPSRIYPPITEYYSKYPSQPQSALIAGTPLSVGNHHAKLYSIDSGPFVSPIGRIFNVTRQFPHPSLSTISPIPLSELDAVDSAIIPELPAQKDTVDAGLLYSSVASSASKKQIDKDQGYDGDGDTSEESMEISRASRMGSI